MRSAGADAVNVGRSATGSTGAECGAGSTTAVDASPCESAACMQSAHTPLRQLCARNALHVHMWHEPPRSAAAVASGGSIIVAGRAPAARTGVDLGAGCSG